MSHLAKEGEDHMREIALEDLDSLAKHYYSGEAPIQAAADRFTKTEMVEFLRRHTNDLERAIREMTPEQMAYRLPGAPNASDASGDERQFDASQIVTHVVSGLTYHWRGMARALGHETPEFTRPPEGAQTTGTKGSILGAGGWAGVPGPELARLLQETADRFLAYLDGLPSELEGSGRIKFATLEDLNAHGWLFLGAIHPAVHLHQLRVMQAQPDYPG